jgi:hypothetical protein
MGRFTHLGLVAATQAYQDSGLDSYRGNLPPDRIGVNIGVGMGGLPEIQNVYDTYRERGFGRITPFFILQVLPNLVSGYLSIMLDLQGPNMCNITACATSAHSIGEAVRSIRFGDADVMIAGGAESVVCELAIGGFAAMKALSTRNDEPARASRPFSADRDGFVIESCFRVYPSIKESYMDHSSYLMSPEKSPRYGTLFALEPTNYRAWAEGLQRGGYSTNPEYAASLIRTIELLRLHELDQKVIKEMKLKRP